MKFPEQFRKQHPIQAYCSRPGDPFGYFIIPARHACGRPLKIIASDGSEEIGWEHVSVSIIDQPTTCPSWREMCLVKSLFWDPHECIVQFHPAQEDYVNQHQGCLHLWRYTPAPFPTPPSWCVGIKTSTAATGSTSPAAGTDSAGEQ